MIDDKPKSAACMSGVQPVLSARLGFAPRSSRNRTAASFCIAAAILALASLLISNAWWTILFASCFGFGAAFGPLIILSLTWDRMTGAGAVAGLVTGAAVVIAWIALGWNAALPGMDAGLYEIVPGFIAAWLAIWLVSKATATGARPLPA